MQTWDAVIAAEPALAVVLSGEHFEAALLAIANFIDLKSPYTLGQRAPSPSWRRRPRRSSALSEGEIRTVRRAGLVHDFGRLGVRTRSGTSPARSAPASGSGCGMQPYLTERML